MVSPQATAYIIDPTRGGAASQAYFYYNADLKHWVETLKVSIAAKAE